MFLIYRNEFGVRILSVMKSEWSGAMPSITRCSESSLAMDEHAIAPTNEDALQKMPGHSSSI